MNSREIYKRFLLKINKNDTNDGISILPSLFVLIFNNERFRWLGEYLKNNGDNIKLDRLDGLLESDVPLVQFQVGDGWVEYTLPDNFYRHSSSYALVNKGNCTNIPFFYFEKKSLGFSANLADDSTKAHFEYEEGPCLFTNGKVKVYTDDFIIVKLLTSFYRVPNAIDIEGYTKIDGSASTNIDSELSDDNVDEIINRVAMEVIREYQDDDAAQFAKDRIGTEP